MEWKEVLLGELVDIYDSKRIPLTSQEREKIKGDIPYYGAQGIIDYINQFLFDGEYILIAEDGNNIKSRQENIAQIAKGKFWVNNHAHILQGKIEQNLLCYIINHTDISGYVTGSAQPKLNQANLLKIPIKIPVNLSDQRKIAGILSALDSKIENNNKINANLEAQAEALFKSWFVDFTPFKDQPFVDSELGPIPQGWKVGKLTDIAVYLNGLAMQKFPPQDIKDSFPVLKIKELGAGICDNSSDRCSNKVPKKYIIEDGDIIFSWSGTLMVDVWCGGQCGLNQHLFKVSSSNYPKWFYYHWTKKHLRDFIHIARDKAVTMGHIKRGHLDNALVVVPNNFILEKATHLFEPLLNMVISKRIENQRLAALRDTLLPKLMSGEIKL